MSYTDDIMIALTHALKDSQKLERTIKEFNTNISVFERLATALEKQNELKEQELLIKKEQILGKHL